MWMDVDTALSEVPVNIMPLLDDTDFKTREEAVAYDAAGLELIWHFTTPAGATTATVVTPTTAGDYDWAHQDGGMYTIEIPASGGASINNDTEGFGWFTGVATGVLPWRGPVIGFRASGLNDKLIESAYSATRGLGGTALPDAAADASGGLPVSDAGGLDLDTQLAETNEITAVRMGALTDWIDGGRLDLLLDAIKAVTDALPDAGALNELATILADTNELQTDWTNGGRLDLLIDAIKVVTDALPDAGALTTLITHLTDIKGAGFSTGTDTLEQIRDRGDAAWTTGGAGSGSEAKQVEVNDKNTGLPLEGVEVSVYTDQAMTNKVAGPLWTDDFGHVTFNLDPGTYWIRRVKPNYTFDTNPYSITVS